MDTLCRIKFGNLLVCLQCVLCCAACSSVETVSGDNSVGRNLRSKVDAVGSASTSSTDRGRATSEHHGDALATKAAGNTTLKSSQTNGSEQQNNVAAYQKCMRDIAAQMDETVEDGWFFGEEPRMFKSFYRKISAEQKAEFAVDYHKFISEFHQNLVSDYKSFVPYSKRADFAMQWWAARVPRFNSSEMKMKVLWAHESIQDAGELWWRAGEKLGKAPNDSVQLMAHDEEQRMVSHFTEKEGSPGTISDQVWKRTH